MKKADGRTAKTSFPLFLHATGQYAKKILGRTVYFGKDRAAALDLWLEQRDDLLAGRTPRLHHGGLPLHALVNTFIAAKRALVVTGELSPRTWTDYHATGGILTKFFGRTRTVETLTAGDFERLRAHLAKTLGPVRLGNEVQRARSFFKYAAENDLIDRPVRFGTAFKRPQRKIIRRARHAAGPKLIEPADVRRLLAAAAGEEVTTGRTDPGTGEPEKARFKANPALRAMMLLAVNCGYGQSDIAGLPKTALDLDRGWAAFPRPKTEVPRRCPLWPETVEAVRAALLKRPTPKDPADAGLVFITKYGKRWVRAKEREGKGAVPIDSVQLEFKKLLKALGLEKPGRGFYTLRHCHRTAADAAKDQPAADLIMGHADPSMGAHYRERIDDGRLTAVTDAVRTWLAG